MIKTWIKALRLRTLPLATGAIILGTFLPYSQGYFDVQIFVFTMITALGLQTISNLANDYGDFLKGSDIHRKDRILNTGSLQPSAMKTGIIISSIITFLSGIYLLFLAFDNISKFAIYLLLGIAGIIAALKYTLGKKPYGYRAMGDIFVFVFFGFVAVFCTAYLQNNVIHIWWLFPAFAYGFLSVAVLNINNTRDIETDKANHKITIPVLVGHTNARVYQLLLCISALLFMVFYVLRISQNYLFLLSLLGFIPIFINVFIFTINKKMSHEKYTKLLKFFVLGSLFFVLSFVGIFLVLS